MASAMPLLIPVAMLLVGAQSWQRRTVRRAQRDLPTRLQRLLGPEPDFAPPEDAPETLTAYVRLYRRTGRVVQVCWGLALAYGVLLAVLYLKGHAS